MTMPRNTGERSRLSWYAEAEWDALASWPADAA
jgi:hypothetical protein